VKSSFQDWVRRAREALLVFLTTRPLDPLPVLRDLSRYDQAKLRADFWAGLNVALLAIPQGMAYAVIAEVPIYYGIIWQRGSRPWWRPHFQDRGTPSSGRPTPRHSWSSGSSPTWKIASAKMVLLPLLVFLVGALLVAGAYLRIADLIQYISRSVVVGYTTGAAVLIIANQSRQVL